jgi:hypothetical protein
MTQGCVHVHVENGVIKVFLHLSGLPTMASFT